MRIVLMILLMLNLVSAKKLALVIGNSNYNQGYLPNPTKDADLIAQKLRDVGFTVTIKKDIKSLDKMKESINNFVRKVKEKDIAVVYYAGHGVQCKGTNYLIPTKAMIAKGGQLESEALNLDFLIGGMSNIKLAVLMIDACRDNTYPSCTKSQKRGLIQPHTPEEGGMIISFATAEGKTADYGYEHSPYALALAKFIDKKMPIETFFRKVGGEVLASSSQRPMLKNSFYGKFSFGGKEIIPITYPPNYNIVTIDGLMYQNQSFTKRYIWEEAKRYCKKLTLGGYSDWRLPTKNELRKLGNIYLYHYDDNWDKWFHKNKYKIIENSNGYQYFIKKEFVEHMPPTNEKDVQSFWSSTEINSTYSWDVNFELGYYDRNYKSNENYALCVR